MHPFTSKKPFYTLTLLLFFLLYSASCTDKPETEILHSYPSTPGNEWLYTRAVNVVTYENQSSVTPLETISITEQVRVWVDGDTILDNKALTIFASTNVNSSFTSREFYVTDAEGLKSYAYQNPGPNVFARKKSGLPEIPALPFNLLSPLGASPPDELTNKIWIYDQARLALKLPLCLADRWTYVHPTEYMDFQIDRKVIGTETIETPAGSFQCTLIRNIYIDPLYLEDIFWIDWIAREGLIKREFRFPRSIMTDPYGEFSGYGEMTELLTLKQLKLN